MNHHYRYRVNGVWHRYYGPAFDSGNASLSSWYIHGKEVIRG